MFITTVSENRSSVRGLFCRLQSQLSQLLIQGALPRQLAFAIAMGVAIGLLPTVWGSSLICILLAAIFRLNQLIVQLANCLVYPLQILLLIPYFRIGESLFASHNLPADFDCFIAELQSAPLTVVHQYWQANLQAILAWLLTTPFLLASCFLLAHFLIVRFLPENHPTEGNYA